MKLNIIVAMCENKGIGYENKLPWKFSTDMKYFSRLTKGNNNNAVIMGRKTHESIGKILPNRYNIILSKSIHKNSNNISFFNNIQDILTFCSEKKFQEVWIIGGETIYKQFLDLKIVNEVYITEIIKSYNCDTFFPLLSKDFTLIDCNYEIENNTKLCFKKYVNL